MCQLHSKLQQADVKEFQLAIEGEGVPVDVTSVHSCLKSLQGPKPSVCMGKQPR